MTIYLPTTVRKSGSSPIGGDVILAEGSNITITQSGGTITISSTGGGGGSPGGSTTELQYNDAGAFGGITGATTDGDITTFAADKLVTPDYVPYTIPDDTARDLFQYRPATLNSINGTGTIEVLLDDTSTTINKYYSGVIRGHNYTGRNEFVIKFGGLWYATGGPTYTTASPSFISVEGSADFGSVRFAYDASNRPCLLIGTTSYVWHQDSHVTLEQVYSSYSNLTEYQRIRDNAPVQTVTRLTSEAGYAVKETKAVAAVNSYTNTSLVKVWGGATPLDYRYSIYNPINLHSGSNTTGTVAIKLPAFVNTVYNIIEVRGFDYTSTTGGWRVTVSGLTNGTSWINSSVNVEGKPPFTSVRLAYIGADYCILLGTTTTAWSRMNISLDLYHKVGASTDPIYTNATDYSITTAITSEASYSIKATYDCAFNAQRFYAGDGTAALPSGSYYVDTDTGPWRPAANTWAVSTGGTERMRVDSSGMVRAGAGTIGLLIDGAGASFQPLLGSSTTSAVSGLSTGVNDGTNNRRAGLFVDQTNAVWGLSHLYASGRIPFVMMSNTTEQFRVDTSHNFGIGTGATISAKLHIISTTVQQRFGYDVSNYFDVTVGSTGIVTLNAVGSGARFNFSDGLTLPAGTATAGTSPLKLTTGPKLTAAEQGVHELDTDHYITNNNSIRYSISGVLPFDNFADVSVGGAETDIYTSTTLANTFGVNGSKVVASYGGNFVTVGTEIVQLKVYFAGTAIWDSTGIAVTTGTTSWNVDVKLIRVSATVVRYNVSLNTTGASGFAYCSVGELTGLTLSGTNILKITGTSSGVGSGAGDIVGKMGFVEFKPAS